MPLHVERNAPRVADSVIERDGVTALELTRLGHYGDRLQIHCATGNDNGTSIASILGCRPLAACLEGLHASNQASLSGSRVVNVYPLRRWPERIRTDGDPLHNQHDGPDGQPLAPRKATGRPGEEEEHGTVSSWNAAHSSDPPDSRISPKWGSAAGAWRDSSGRRSQRPRQCPFQRDGQGHQHADHTPPAPGREPIAVIDP